MNGHFQLNDRKMRPDSPIMRKGGGHTSSSSLFVIVKYDDTIVSEISYVQFGIGQRTTDNSPQCVIMVRP